MMTDKSLIDQFLNTQCHLKKAEIAVDPKFIEELQELLFVFDSQLEVIENDKSL